jgi:hypothetical protein
VTPPSFRFFNPNPKKRSDQHRMVTIRTCPEVLQPCSEVDLMPTEAIPLSSRNAQQTAGKRLVEELAKENDPYEITLMIIEAGRVANRLENLDALLSGERSAWLHVRVNKDQVLEVKIDNALQEARAQTTVLRNLITDIHRHRARIPMQDDPDDDVLVGLT